MKDSNDSPLVTFALISYNQEQYIEEALKSALAQTYTPLEIVVSDDCSPDNTYQIIKDIEKNYQGPHELKISQNEKNLGLAGNVNKVWEMASGELVVFQAGDDISLSHRVFTLVEAWCSRNLKPDLVYSGVKFIDEKGEVIGENTVVSLDAPDIDDTITGKKTFVAGGCAAAYSRALHWKTGPLGENVIAEDFVYSFRAMLGNGIVGLPEPLVLYRQNPESIIGKLQDNRIQDERLLSGEYAKLKEFKAAIDVYGGVSPYLLWRLNRRINTYTKKLQVHHSGPPKRLIFALWALVTGRFRLFLEISNQLL